MPRSRIHRDDVRYRRARKPFWLPHHNGDLGVGFALVIAWLVLANSVLSLAVALVLFGASIGTFDVAMNIQAVMVEKDLGASNIVPVLFTAAGKQTRMPASLAVAAITTLGYAGILLGPAAIGFVAQHLSIGAGFVAIAIGLLVVGIVGPSVYRRLWT